MPRPAGDPPRVPPPPKPTTTTSQAADAARERRRTQRATSSATLASVLAASHTIDRGATTDTSADPTVALDVDVLMAAVGLWLVFVTAASAVITDAVDPLILFLTQDSVEISSITIPAYAGSGSPVLVPLPPPIPVEVTSANTTIEFELAKDVPGPWTSPVLTIAAYRLGDLT